MRKIAILIPVIAAVMIMFAAPVRSDEGSTYGTQEKSTGQKDECLLVAMNCVDNVDSIQQRIDKLQKEINRGTDVYTAGELRILNQKLDESNALMNEMVIK